MKRLGSRSLAVLGLLIACSTPPVSGETAPLDCDSPPPFPLHGDRHYRVTYLGITCGHLNLKSSLEVLEGRPVYHFTLRARNSKFFNRIYRVDARIESWVDARKLRTIRYESEITEKGKTSSEMHTIDWETLTVRSIEDGEEREFTLDEDRPVLDPLSFVFRLQALAGATEGPKTLTLITDRGPVDAIATVDDPARRRTVDGRKNLVEVQPKSEDGKVFSRKGRFSLWVDPTGDTRLYTLDFKLSFGRLIAEITDPT